MSWKRILQAARRLNSPVIVADEAAKEPLVILPLDVYEKMSETADRRPPAQPRLTEAEAEAERMASIFESAMESLAEEEMPVISQKVEAPRMVERRVEAPATPSLEAEMPLEDKYYFEPLEDEPKK